MSGGRCSICRIKEQIPFSLSSSPRRALFSSVNFTRHLQQAQATAMQSFHVHLSRLLYAMMAIVYPTLAIKWFGSRRNPPPGDGLLPSGLPADPDEFLRHPELMPQVVGGFLSDGRDQWCSECIGWCMNPGSPVDPKSLLGRLISAGRVRRMLLLS